MFRGSPCCYGRVQRFEVGRKARAVSWARPWPIVRAALLDVSKHLGFGAHCTARCKGHEWGVQGLHRVWAGPGASLTSGDDKACIGG